MDYLAVVYFHVCLYSVNGVAFSEIYAVIKYNSTSLDPTVLSYNKNVVCKGGAIYTTQPYVIFLNKQYFVLSNLQWIIPENIRISTTKKIKLTPL